MGAEGPIRKMAEAPRRPGDRATAGARPTPTIGRSEYGRGLEGEAHKSAIAIKDKGTAGLEHGNDFGDHPQTNMELRAWKESVAVISNANAVGGAILIDPNVASVWYVNLSADASLSILSPAALPQSQIDAQRNRARGVSVTLIVQRNGRRLQLPAGIRWRDGEAPAPAANSPFEVYSLLWVGGLGAGLGWFGFNCGEGFAAA